ncbi:MAG: DMT family transporter [Gammaproteobacteria bacterium]
MKNRLIASVAPVVFVLLWSTGFIGAKYALPYVEPYTLLFVRFVISLAVLLVLFAYFKPVLPATWPQRLHLMLSGLLVHGAYLGGVFSAIKLGMPAGVCALLVGLQPLLTAIATPFVFKRRLPLLHWIGIVAGFVGIAMVLSNQITADGFGANAVIAATVALLGITVGAIYQKKITAHSNVLSIAFFQYLSATMLFAAGSLIFESGHVIWDMQLILALLWLVFGLSIGAILLLNYLIRKNEAHKVSSLFYLVPPLTALEAYFLFDETLGIINLTGMVIVVISVFVVMKK